MQLEKTTTKKIALGKLAKKIKIDEIVWEDPFSDGNLFIKRVFFLIFCLLISIENSILYYYLNSAANLYLYIIYYWLLFFIINFLFLLLWFFGIWERSKMKSMKVIK